VYQDLDVLVLVVDQLSDAAVDDVVERDPPGDERCGVPLAVDEQSDRVRVVVAVRECPADGLPCESAHGGRVPTELVT
jgi:hypothetical protein